MEKLILTPNIARELTTAYEQFVKFKKDEVDGLSFDEYQKLLVAYGELYFNTKNIQAVLRELAELADSGQESLPQAAVPNADQLKRLVEAHEEFLKQKDSRDTSWKKLQTTIVERRLKDLEAQQSVVYAAEKELAGVGAQETPTTPTRPRYPETPISSTRQPDEISGWSRQKEIENLQAVIEEANFPKGLSQEAARQLHQFLSLNKQEGRVLTSEDLRSRVQAILARLNIDQQTAVAQSQIGQITERVYQDQPQAAPVSQAFTKLPRPLRPQQPLETRGETKPAAGVSKETNHIYLALRGAPYWLQLARQLNPASWVGFGTKNGIPLESINNVLNAIERLKIEKPRVYAKDLPLLLAVQERVEQLLEAGKIIKEAEFYSAEEIEQALTQLDKAGVEISRLQINPQTEELEKEKESKESLLEKLAARRKQALEHVGLKQGLGELQQEATKLRQTVSSAAQIRLKQILANLGSGFGRFFSSAVRSTFGVAGRVTGGIAQSFGLGPSFSTAFSKIGSSLFGLGGSAGRIGASLLSRAIIGLTTLGGAEALPVVAAVAIGFGVLFALVFLVATIQHGVFLKETTSAPIIRESQFINLTKTADKTNIQSLPEQVTYTITISAKDKTLNNLRTREEFSVYSRGSPPQITATQHSVKTVLTPGEQDSFNFSVNLAPEYQDSVVTNTVTVIADVQDGPSGETISRAISIIIGNPPTGCFSFQTGWSSDFERAQVSEMIARIARSPAYMANLCKGGNVNLIRVNDNPGYGGEVRGKSNIYLYNRAFHREGGYIWQNLFYTLAHETGHVYGWRNPVEYIFFPTAVYGEPFLPTYTLTKSQDEDFAETIAVYVVRRAVPNLSGYNIINMDTTSPKHYQFAKNRIFGGFDGF